MFTVTQEQMQPRSRWWPQKQDSWGALGSTSLPKVKTRSLEYQKTTIAIQPSKQACSLLQNWPFSMLPQHKPQIRSWHGIITTQDSIMLYINLSEKQWDYCACMLMTFTFWCQQSDFSERRPTMRASMIWHLAHTPNMYGSLCVPAHICLNKCSKVNLPCSL